MKISVEDNPVRRASPGLPERALPDETPQVQSEERTARLSVLIDPKKKACFEGLCKQEDVTPSQVVRQLIREFIESRLGPDWQNQVLGTSKQGLKEISSLAPSSSLPS
jgi:hypothetical protein